jgi:hypothetical protein
MATEFIGLSVVVTLQHPPNTIVYGVVAAVNSATLTLSLQNGALLYLTLLEGDILRTNQSFFQRPATVYHHTMSKGTRSPISKSTFHQPLLRNRILRVPIFQHINSIPQAIHSGVLAISDSRFPIMSANLRYNTRANLFVSPRSSRLRRPHLWILPS